MAGIGFVLRKLVQRGNVSDMLRAYFHAAFATCGTWLFTVLALGIFFLLFRTWPSVLEVETFRAITLYNFSFSLVFSAPITMLTTRVLADWIYQKNLEEGSSLMLGSLITILLIAFPISVWFYFGYVELSTPVAIIAVINFLIISGIWLLSVFITAMQYYYFVTVSFVIGLTISLFLATLFAYGGLTEDGVFNMTLGFTIGLGVILSSLIALVFQEYPGPCRNLFRFLSYMKTYKEIVLGGICYNTAIWIDKWIMWFSPERIVTEHGFIMYPDYDVSMFVAYLTIVPGMALFLISKETSFYEKYLLFFQDILKHANLKKILANQAALQQSFFKNGLSLVLLQISISTIVLLTSFKIFEWFALSYIQVGIFRFGVLGSMLQVLTLFLTIFCSYLNYQRGVLYIQALFLLTNALFTWASIEMGFAFYGYGYFLSTLVTFVFAAYIAEKYLEKLPYHTFITSNRT